MARVMWGKRGTGWAAHMTGWLHINNWLVATKVCCLHSRRLQRTKAQRALPVRPPVPWIRPFSRHTTPRSTTRQAPRFKTCHLQSPTHLQLAGHSLQQLRQALPCQAADAHRLLAAGGHRANHSGVSAGIHLRRVWAGEGRALSEWTGEGRALSE